MVVKRQKGKKKWFPIMAKGEFDKADLGESYVRNVDSLVGKKLKVNMMALTNDPRKQSVTLMFAVTKVENNSGVAELVGYRMSSSHVKRVVRKAVMRIDDSFVLETKDKVKFRVKPLIITRFKTNKGVCSDLRKRGKEFIGEEFLKMKSDDVFVQVMSNKLQIDLKKDLKKIYPIAICEIRVLERV